MNSRRSPLGNGILIVLSILLCIALGCLMLWDRRKDQETILELKQEEIKLDDSLGESGEGDVPTENSGQSETENGKDDTDSSEPAADESVDSESEENISEVQGISFRGDSFGSEDDKAEKGVGICLSKILTENGQDLTVADYSMDVAGTLSQMRLAGVAQSDLDAYLEKHQEEANGAELRITEKKIRDLSEEDLKREDQTYIPVICMGYYGGWGNDLDELCEQQQKILDTYQQKEQYLILGIYPSGFSDKKAYKDKMNERWGEHYVSLDDVIIHSASSVEGKKEIAQAIFDKLMELGYLS